MSQNLAFFSADTLGVTLYQLEAKLKSSEVRQLHLGPWRMDLQVDVVSDLISSKEMTFWVTIGKKLQVYLIVRDAETYLLVLHGDTLKACGKKTGFEATTVTGRLEEIKLSIRDGFHWTKDNWTQISIIDIVSLVGK